MMSNTHQTALTGLVKWPAENSPPQAASSDTRSRSRTSDATRIPFSVLTHGNTADNRTEQPIFHAAYRGVDSPLNQEKNT